MNINWLFWRALFAFLVLPGNVAFLIPWLLRPRGAQFQTIGLVPFVIGVVVLFWCIRDFYVAGRGTLAPWSPPKNLVVVGLYRFSRNPMYVGVELILVGWALGYHSNTLWFYAIAVLVMFHIRVVGFEEPWLSKTHGAEFAAYKSRVPRWIIGAL